MELERDLPQKKINNNKCSNVLNKYNYTRTDDNYAINEKHIRWVRKIDECLYICTKQTGCSLKFDTQQICKLNNPSSYDRLNKLFNECNE